MWPAKTTGRPPSVPKVPTNENIYTDLNINVKPSRAI